jgi:hypothetical protein
MTTTSPIARDLYAVEVIVNLHKLLRKGETLHATSPDEMRAYLLVVMQSAQHVLSHRALLAELGRRQTLALGTSRTVPAADLRRHLRSSKALRGSGTLAVRECLASVEGWLREIDGGRTLH